MTTPDTGHIIHVNGEPLPEPIPVQAGDDLAFVVQDGQIGVSVTKGESAVAEIDKQLEAEAREYRIAWLGFDPIGDWKGLSDFKRADWLRVAAKAREIAAAERQPLVEAAGRYLDHGDAECDCDGEYRCDMCSIRAALAAVKGGGG